MNTRPYLACITTQPAHGSDAYRPLYGLPSCVHFEELDGSSLILGPGLWDKQELEKLKTCCQLLLDAARGPDLPVTPFLSEKRRLLPMFLEWLEALPLDFRASTSVCGGNTETGARVKGRIWIITYSIVHA